MKRLLAMAFTMTWAFAPVSSDAGLITVTFPFGFDGPGNTNDCSGVFGTFSDPCDVGLGLPDPQMVSPIIAKYDTDGTGWSVNPDFSSIDTSEFTVNGSAGGSGTWSYLQGADDPDIKYWVGKGGNNGFNLYWVVPDANTNDGVNCFGDGTAASGNLGSYNLTCLNLAIPQTSGIWSTPTGQGLSHIGFYDTGGTTTTGGGTTTGVAPEPGSLLLLGLGVAGLGVRRFRSVREQGRR